MQFAHHHNAVARRELGYSANDHMNDIAEIISPNNTLRQPKTLLNYTNKMNELIGNSNLPISGIPIPIEFMANRSGRADKLKNAYSVTGDSGTKGGVLVDTETLYSLWQDQLYSNLSFDAIGIMQLSGLIGDIKVPIMGGKINAVTTGESSTLPTSDTIIGAESTKPHHIGAHFEITNLLDMQAVASTNMLLMSALNSLDEEFLHQIIRGDGAGNNITGIVDTTGITQVNVQYTASNYDILANDDIARALMTPLVQDAATTTFIVDPDFTQLAMSSHVENSIDSPMVNIDLKETMGVKNHHTDAFNFASTSDIGITGDFGKVLTVRYGMPTITINPITGAGSGKISVTVSDFCDMIVMQKRALCIVKSANI